jgi:hypothetical protein
MNRAWLATMTFVLCCAACSGDGANGPTPTPASSGTAVVGPAGGSVTATLTGGGSIALTIPAQAVTSPTTFTIEPMAPVAPALAKFRLRPAAVVFDGELTLAVTLSPGNSLPELVTLGYRAGAARVLVPVTVDRTSRRVEARLRSLGTAADAALAVRLTAAPGDAEFSFDESTIATIVAAADAAVTRMEAQQTIEAADALNTTVDAVTQIPAAPALESQVRPLYTRWREVLCTRVAAALTQYAAVSTAAPFDFPDYARETKTMVAWTGVVKELEAMAPIASVQTCTQGSAAGIEGVSDKTDEFISRIQAIIDATDVRVRFNEVLENRIPILLQLERDLTLLSLEVLMPKMRQLSGRFLDRLRAAGYGFCLDVGHLYYLARLLQEELRSAELLSQYDAAALVADLGACGTQMEWRARDSASATLQQGVLGGTAPGAAVPQAATPLPAGGSLRFAGLVRPLQCTGTNQFDFTLNQESLRFEVRNGSQTQTVGTQSLPSGLPADYFRVAPVVFTAAQLRTAAGIAGDSGNFEVRVVRVGNSCGFPMDQLGSATSIGSLNVTLVPSQTFRIDEPNDPMELTGIGSFETFSATAVGCGSTVQWSAQGLPTGWTIEPQSNSAEFSGPVSPGATYLITVTARCGALTDTQQYHMVVRSTD